MSQATITKLYIVHQTPIVDEHGKQQYITEIGIDELEHYGEKLLSIIRSGIEAAEKVLKRRELEPCRDLKGIELAVCVLERIADAISIALRRFFITPLIPYPLTDRVKEVTPTPHDVLYTWVLGRGSKLVDHVLGPTGLITRTDIDYPTLKNIVNLVMSSLGDRIVKPPTSEQEALERLELLMNLPSDTRPGCSISKLIPHLMATAGLAVAKYLSRIGVQSAVHRLELALLRLASLLHDIGKPYAWVKTFRSGSFVSHAAESSQLIERLGLRDLLRGYGLEDVFEALKTLIEKHHSINELPTKARIESLGIEMDLRRLGELLAEADRDSSNIDRLSEYFSKIVEDLMAEEAKRHGIDVRTMFVGTGPTVWRAWLEIPSEKLREIAQRIASRVRARVIDPDLISSRSEPVKDVKLLTVDVAGIQRFIRRESLRVVMAASFAIDLLTVYAIPRALIEKLGISIDSIVYAGGGFVIVFVPANISESTVVEALDHAKKIIGLNIELNYALIELERSWPRSLRAAVSMLAARKSIVTSVDRGPLLTGYEVMCEVCGLRPAKKRLDQPGARTSVCDECKALHDFGSSMYVRLRLATLEAYGYRCATDYLEKLSKVYQHLMPWLSGVEPDEALYRQYSVAIVKADGNAAGQFMASAMNIAEAMCRSIRIDMGLKLGFVAALQKLREKLGNEFEKLAVRAYVGTLYAGGDDLLAIWPASIALPMALALAKAFWRINGGELQLSISIASAKPKHNVWNILDAASYSLNLCKREYRQSYAEALGHTLVAVLTVVKSEWQLFEAEVEELLRTYRARGLSQQPLAVPLAAGLGSPPPCSSALHVLSRTVASALGVTAASLDELVDALLEAYRRQNLVNDLIDAVHDAMGALESCRDWITLALYLARCAQRARAYGRESVARIYEGLAKLCLECHSLPPLFDLYHIAQTLKLG